MKHLIPVSIKPAAAQIPSLPEMRAPKRRKAKSDQLELLLPFDGLAAKPSKGDFIDPRFDLRLHQADSSARA